MNDLARVLRRHQTEAEKRLWYFLKNRGLGGRKFRRQHPLGPYVVDLICIEARLAVEVDGGQHQERTVEDAARTSFLRQNGYRVIRFWNNDVLSNTEEVLSTILAALGPSPQPSPRKRGEGEVDSPSFGQRGENAAEEAGSLSPGHGGEHMAEESGSLSPGHGGEGRGEGDP